MMSYGFIYFLFLFLSIAIAVGGQLLFKAGMVKADAGSIPLYLIPFELHVLSGLVLYGISLLLYLAALKKIPLSIAYPSIGLSYVVVVVLSRLFFHETLSLHQSAGVALIFVGVCLLWK